MSFREKVQKVVLEMAEGQNLKEIKENLLKSISKEIKENHEKIIMESLEDWKHGTIKAAIFEVIRDLTPKQKKELFGELMKDESKT